MGITEAREHLKKFGKDHEILELGVSSATVELAAKALGTDEHRIAKTLSFRVADKAVIVVTAGNMKIDNGKFKEEFGSKASMLSSDEVSRMIGHEIGGVCPFGIRKDVDVYLDISMRQYDYIYPACGSQNSAIRLTCDELQEISLSKKWIDVCKEKRILNTL